MSGLVSPPRNSVAGIFVYSTTRPRCEESRSQSLEPHPKVFQTQNLWGESSFQYVRWFSSAVQISDIQCATFSQCKLIRAVSVMAQEEMAAEEMAANCFHNHCQCNYIIVLGIGVTWHSRMSNASKGCQISRVLSSYAGPGRRCINAMWQYQIGCLHSCDIHHSVFLLSKEVTLRDPFETHGPGRVWTRRGGGPFMWMVHFSQKHSKW